MLAAKCGHTEKVNTLIEAGADVKSQKVSNTQPIV